jgi:hypothetical protein
VHRIGPSPYLQYQPTWLNRPEPTGRTAAALTCKLRTAVRTMAAAGRRCFPPSTALATVFPTSAHRLSPPPRALAVLIHCRPWAVIEANPCFTSSLPARLPRLSSVLPCASDELSKKAPQAPRAPPTRVTELCSSQAASLKTTLKPLHQTVPPPWAPPHHQPPSATDRPRRQSSSITPLRSSSPTREPPALLTRQRHHQRFPLA